MNRMIAILGFDYNLLDLVFLQGIGFHYKDGIWQSSTRFMWRNIKNLALQKWHLGTLTASMCSLDRFLIIR